jgi:two-component system CheB/CheR fusion protein
VNDEQVNGGSLNSPDRRRIVPVVGIGASAGGLEVFKRLLADLSGDTGFAIVLVQHLAPNHPSILADILGRATPMPVSEAADGVTLEANHVYVIPANADMMLMDCGVLKLTPRTQTGPHMPIDCLLRSLADHCGSKAIGIILSGTGSDGSAGLEAIKAADGVTFAQEPATARFAAMPLSAITAGCVDLILPPEGIAAELNRIGQHSYIADDRPQEISPDDKERFAAILAVLRRATGIDFSLYREKMVRRRILRRIALRNIDGLEEYLQHLENNPEEVAALQRDLLISVTSFFRDGEAFDSLKKVVFPRLLQGRTQGETIRVWSAGCATGEEAFSLAILLQEYLSENAFTCAVQIFASDLSLPAIEKARAGKYPESIAADITPERLNRYFGKIEGGYQILKGLRDTVVFARHNLIQDPPFSKLDFISCRNVLIYLSGVQKNIIPLFHYALKPNGFLMLGSAEAAVSGELFSEADREHRIYSKLETPKRRNVLHPAAGGTSGGGEQGRRAARASAAGNSDGDDVRKQVDRLLLSRYGPASVLVDEDLEVLEIRGKPNPYLTLPAGKVSFNLIKLLPDTGLFLEVQQLVLKAGKTGETERRECLSYEHEGTTREINVEAVPLHSPERPATLVLFEAVPPPDGRAAQPPLARNRRDAREREISQLKRQLEDAKERILSLTEGHQTYREESQNTTEEALSANEELQSLNEELETAKEELQSTNEELVTVNDELQAKNALLAQARDFALSIVETVRQPLLVLDTGLRIRMANRAFYRAFQVSQAEAEGQDIFSLGRGVWDLPALRDVLNGLLQDGSPVPDFEIERDFPGLGHRSLVIGGCRINHLKMILLAVDDITESKLAQNALRISEEHLRQSQKMEAVGRLAGGIAHDFNNLLTASIGYSSLLYDRLGADPTGMQYVLEIQHAGERAASLTQQLLAFSRRQVLQPKVFDLNTIVADFDRMLRRLVGERINVIVNSEPELWQVWADPGEIGRAIMNLSLNARDAMPAGGTLTIQTANATLSETELSNQALSPGRYVSLSVRDTGIGIDADVQAHIFEPFFTTKEIGKGTGLGLATVLGVVEQTGGFIRCNSQPGEGTTFTVFLPAVVGIGKTESTPAGGLAAAPKGAENILLVEDEDGVRRLARNVLEASGYVVYEARNGREGLALFETHDGPIDLLLTDVVMPELGGRELAEKAAKLRPGLRVLFMSGHTADVVLREGVQQGTPFLQKPFRPSGLASKVREVLDSDAPYCDEPGGH